MAPKRNASKEKDKAGDEPVPESPPAKISKTAAIAALLGGQAKAVSVSKSSGAGPSECTFTLDYTTVQKGEGKGTKTKNLLVTFTVSFGEYTALKNLFDSIPGHSGVWYNKNTKLNMSKPATPEVANCMLQALKRACPKSAASYPEEVASPVGFLQPFLTVVKVPFIQLADGETLSLPHFFLVGNTYVWKEWFKSTYNGVQYTGICFGGTENMAWILLADAASEDPETGLVARLQRFGVRVQLEDLTE